MNSDLYKQWVSEEHGCISLISLQLSDFVMSDNIQLVSNVTSLRKRTWEKFIV